jgi:hypothetical protein
MSVLVDDYYQPTDQDFTNAFNQAIGTSQVVLLADKTYPVSTLAPLPAGTTIIGVSRNQSIILATAPTGDVITAGAYVTLGRLQIGSSVPRTGGNFINVTGAEFKIDDFTLAGAFNGITISNGVAITQIADGVVNDTASGGTVFTYGSSGGAGPLANYMSNIVMNSPNAVEANISLVNCGDLTMFYVQALSASNNLYVCPPSGCQVDSIKATACWFDHGASTNLMSNPTGGGAWYRSDFTNCWFGSGTTNNVVLQSRDSKSNIENITFNQCDGVLSGGSGLVCIGRISNIAWHGGRLAGNVAGFWLEPSAGFGGLEVKNAKIGACGGFGANSMFGGNLADAGGNNQIVYNDFVGNAFNNASSGAGNIVSPNIVRAH